MNNTARRLATLLCALAILPACQTGEPHRVSNEEQLLDRVGRGKAVLVLFLGTDCPSCMRQLGAFAAEQDRFAAAGVRLLCISGIAEAGTPDDRLKPFVRLFDPSFDVFRAFDAYAPDAGPLHAVVVFDGGRATWKTVGTRPFMDIEHVLEEAG